MVALIVTFVGSCITTETPLEAIQLLWVNLIMDSLASLALATEMPKPHLLKRMPQNRDDYIVSRKMIKHILGQAIWQCIILFICLFAGEYFIYEPEEEYHYAVYKRDNIVAGRNYQMVFPGRKTDWSGDPLWE